MAEGQRPVEGQSLPNNSLAEAQNNNNNNKLSNPLKPRPVFTSPPLALTMPPDTPEPASGGGANRGGSEGGASDGAGSPPMSTRSKRCLICLEIGHETFGQPR